MTTITIIDSSWRHNENCCYANMRSQGQAFVCWHLNLSVTCGTVVPRRWTCLSVILPYSTNIPVLVQIMAWRRPGDKPLSEPVVVNLLTHICVTRPLAGLVSVLVTTLFVGLPLVEDLTWLLIQTLEWHCINLKLSLITGNLTICSTTCSVWQTKQISKPWITGPLYGGFMHFRASNAEHITMSWRHHDFFFPQVTGAGLILISWVKYWRIWWLW